MANVTKRKSAVPDAKRHPEMGHLDSPWPTYGGSANYTMGLSGTVWPLYTWERGCMRWPCLRTALLFAKIFLDHVTKPRVWGHSEYILGHIFVFLRNLYCGGYFGRQASRTKKTSRNIGVAKRGAGVR